VPRWWAGQGGAVGRVLDVALLPAGGAFRAISGARNAAFDRGILAVERAPVPVISIGNLAVGGAGKTPLSAWTAARLRGWGRRPAIALRGYGGDEVLLHRELNPAVPVFAAPRRIDAAREAGAAGCDVVVLDDGFQHRALARDLDVVLVAVEGWRARPRLLPRGPWREGFGALRRADVVVLTRKSAPLARADEVAAALARSHPHLPIAVCHLAPGGLAPLHGGGALRPVEWLAGWRVFAVAALATPGPFLEHLAAAGAGVEPALFADHHEFTAAEAGEVIRSADGRVLVMTQKDAVKLRPLLSPDVEAFVLEQTVKFDRGGDALDEALRRAVGG